MTNEETLPDWLRQQCGHDSRSVPECGHCEAADELERLSRPRPQSSNDSVATLRLLAKCGSMDLSMLGPIADEMERLTRVSLAARALLKYIDDHDWGLIPEGQTADTLRDLLKGVPEPDEPLLQHPSDGWRCVTCGHENPRGALQCQNQECPVLKSSLCTCAPHLDPMGCNNDACPRVIEQRRQRRANEQKSDPGAPPPPEVLADALQDVVHTDPGQVRAGRAVREWNFDRYRNGKLMSQGVTVHAANYADAYEKAVTLLFTDGNKPIDELRLQEKSGVSNGG